MTAAEELAALEELLGLYDFMAQSNFGERPGEKAAIYGMALRLAIARVQAAQAPAPAAVPDGYALVPLEPTLAMRDAGHRAAWRRIPSIFDDGDAGNVYRAMLTAALGKCSAEPNGSFSMPPAAVLEAIYRWANATEECYSTWGEGYESAREWVLLMLVRGKP